MDRKRKEAREKLHGIRTKQELFEYLDNLVLTDEEKQVAIEMFLYGFSHIQISMKHSFSVEKSKKIINKVLSKV